MTSKAQEYPRPVCLEDVPVTRCWRCPRGSRRPARALRLSGTCTARAVETCPRRPARWRRTTRTRCACPLSRRWSRRAISPANHTAIASVCIANTTSSSACSRPTFNRVLGDRKRRRDVTDDRAVERESCVGDTHGRGAASSTGRRSQSRIIWVSPRGDAASEMIAAMRTVTSGRSRSSAQVAAAR